MQKEVAAEFQEVMAQMPQTISLSIWNVNEEKNLHKTPRKVQSAAVPTDRGILLCWYPAQCWTHHGFLSWLASAQDPTLVPEPGESANRKAICWLSSNRGSLTRLSQLTGLQHGTAASPSPLPSQNCLQPSNKKWCHTQEPYKRQPSFFQAKHLRNNGSNPVISVWECRGKGRRTHHVRLCHF